MHFVTFNFYELAWRGIVFGITGGCHGFESCADKHQDRNATKEICSYTYWPSEPITLLFFLTFRHCCPYKDRSFKGCLAKPNHIHLVLRCDSLQCCFNLKNVAFGLPSA